MTGQNRISNVVSVTAGLILLLTLRATESSKIRMNENGGYENIVVSIGKEVPPIACQQLIQNIQVYMSHVSYHLAPLIHHFSA